jgi:hypothetical protein
MSSSRAAYTPGAWVAVGAEAGWLLVDIDPTDGIVLEAWSLLRAAAEIDEIVEAVLHRGLRAVSSFALARVSGDRRAVVVRGAADAMIIVEGRSEHVSAAGVATWREYPLPANASAVQLRVGATPSDVNEAPLRSGVTLASTIRIALTDGPVAPPAGRPGPAATPSRPAQSQASAAPANGAAPSPAGAPAPVPQPPVLPAPAPQQPVLPAPASQQPVLAAPGPPVGAERTPDPGPLPGPPTAPLLHSPLDPAPPDAPEPDSMAWLAAVRPLGPPVEDSQPYRPPPSGGAAPGAAPSPPTAELPVWSPPPPDSPDSTVSRTTLTGTRDEPGPSASTVQAVRCQHGHLSPPIAVSCRVCGFPLMGQAPVTVPRPTLGVLRLSTGDVVPLDRTVIMGRNPRSEASDERPHLVRLPSPGHDISRTHIEVRLDGWHVLLTDLNSVNGTVVTPPWQEPQRLRPNEAVPIEPGTVVSLADEVTFRYEVTG